MLRGVEGRIRLSRALGTLWNCMGTALEIIVVQFLGLARDTKFLLAERVL